MKQLLLLRHAKSSWDEPDLADHDRPLSERGEHDLPNVAAAMAERGLRPDLVLCSTAKRAKKTANKVLKLAGWDIELRLIPSLYLATPATYISQLQQVPDQSDTVLVVGHNPGISELLGALTGTAREMPTAAVAQIEIPVHSWSELTLDSDAALKWFWQPD